MQGTSEATETFDFSNSSAKYAFVTSSTWEENSCKSYVWDYWSPLITVLSTAMVGTQCTSAHPRWLHRCQQKLFSRFAVRDSPIHLLLSSPGIVPDILKGRGVCSVIFHLVNVNMMLIIQKSCAEAEHICTYNYLYSNLFSTTKGLSISE